MNRESQVTFQPDPDQLALMPDRSGNAINGLGETTFRRPSRIYWHNPGKIAHGELQQWMVNRFNAVPEFREVYATGDRGPRKLDPVAPVRQRHTSENWSALVKTFALLHEADLAGVARLNPDWLYSDCEVRQGLWIIVLGVAMDHARLAQAPSSDENTASALEVAAQYNRSARSAAYVANWIRSQGYYSEAHAGPWAGPLTLTPAALACGFGELGKHGSIINRRFGSSFRISGVITDLPLVPDKAVEIGADDFCSRCQVCVNACPPDAISNAKESVRGVEKWYVDFDKCVPYFNETHGCGICIAVCPWSTPGAAPRLAEKMLRRRQRLETEDS